MKYDLCALGNALLDFQVQTPFDFLKELEVAKGAMTLVDTAWQADALKKIHESFHKDLEMNSGGSAANTAAGLANFGGKACYFGRVGTDHNAKVYRQDLEKIGIDCHLAEDSSSPTGVCLALVTPDAERTMMTSLGAAVLLNENDISADPIKNSRHLYIEGYLWDSLSARKASVKAWQIATESKIPVAFTYSDSFCVERHHADFLDLAKTKIQILFCNELEAVRATGAKNPHDAFHQMKDWCETVCVTLGPQGALLSNKSSNTQEEIGTWDVPLVDKLGAGDLFAAGFLYGLSTKKSLRESGYLGCYAATKAIQQMGARLKSSLNPDILLALKGPETSGRAQFAQA